MTSDDEDVPIRVDFRDPPRRAREPAPFMAPPCAINGASLHAVPTCPPDFFTATWAAARRAMDENTKLTETSGRVVRALLVAPRATAIVAALCAVGCSTSAPSSTGLAPPTTSASCDRNFYTDEVVCYPKTDMGTALGEHIANLKFLGYEVLDSNVRLTKPPQSPSVVALSDFYDPEARRSRLLMIVTVGANGPLNVALVQAAQALAQHGVLVIGVLAPSATLADLNAFVYSEAPNFTVVVGGEALFEIEPQLTPGIPFFAYIDARTMELLGFDQKNDTTFGAAGDWLTTIDANPPWQASACDCAAEPPWGWRWVGYRNARPDCATGWETPLDLDELRSPPQDAICDCSCGPPSGTQTCTLTQVIFETEDSLCSGTSSTGIPATSGTCTAASFTTTSPNAGVSISASTSGMTCATNSTAVAPPLDEAQARECEAPPGNGSCGAGQVCLPPGDASPWSRCIETYGASDTTCPAGFPDKHVVGTHVNDTRNCGPPCICNTFAPCDETIDVYTDSSCTQGKTSLVPTACYPGSSFSVGSFIATATPAGNVTCGEAWPYPVATGGVSLDSARVICCAL